MAGPKRQGLVQRWTRRALGQRWSQDL